MTENDQKYILAIDLGTSGSKTALVTVLGEVIDFEFEKVPLILLPNGGAEQNPDDWWQAIMTTSKKLLSKQLVPVDDIVAISCSTHWMGTVPVDREGNALMNGIIWMDARGAKYVRKLFEGPIKIAGYDVRKLLKWVRLTGGAPVLSGKDAAGHILFIKNEFPDVYKKTYKFLEPIDYINMRFTGIFSASYNSITDHWVTDNRDLSKITYSDALLKITTIDREKLPDLKGSIEVLGPLKKNIAEELGLNAGVRVVMGSPDYHAAAIGSGAIKDFEGHICIGTSSWISAHIPFKKLDAIHSIATLPSAIPDRYLIADEQDAAGANLAFLKDNILYHEDELLKEEALPDVYKIFDRIAEKAPAGSNKVIYTPWLNGELTPVMDNTVRASIYNLSLSSTRADIIRAFLEGVAFNQRWLLKYIEKFIKRKMDPIHIVGGGASSDIWCQIHADVLNRTIKQVKDPIQTNARGAAFIASVGLGYITFEDIPKYIQIKKTFKPNPENRKIYDQLFAEFLNIYKNNKSIFKRLNSIS